MHASLASGANASAKGHWNTRGRYPKYLNLLSEIQLPGDHNAMEPPPMRTSHESGSPFLATRQVVRRAKNPKLAFDGSQVTGGDSLQPGPSFLFTSRVFGVQWRGKAAQSCADYWSTYVATNDGNGSERRMGMAINFPAERTMTGACAGYGCTK